MNNFKREKKKLLPVNFEESTGKLPPQAVELEEVVLGAMLLEKEAIEQVISILNPESFYKEAHMIIYTAIVSLYKRSEPADIMTVTKELHNLNQLEQIGGAYFISTLTTRVASSANIEIHARVLLEKQLARDLIRININGIKQAYENGTDVFDLYAKQSQLLDGCLDGVMKYESKSIGEAHTDSIIEHQEILKSGRVPGVPTGFRMLDKFTGGWQKSDLIIIGARPGMGKTSCVVSFAKNASILYKKPTAIFSLEMSTKQLTDKIQSDISEIHLSDIIKKRLNQEQINYMDKTCKELYTAPLYIDDTPALTLLELKTKARKLKQKYKIELLIIDYLQLMSGANESSGNREQEISSISRGLKGLAKELEIPIIALSQLSRQVESSSRKTNKPQLSDLRESGAIEQDADIVMFCYRPSYYEMDEHIIENEPFPADGLFDLIIAKNRHGSTGNVILGWIPQFTKLVNYDVANKRVEWPTQNSIAQTNNNFGISNKNNTFVQHVVTPMNKIAENTDFLTQKPDTNDDRPF